MSGFGRRYVVDTNALNAIGSLRRATNYFREHAVLPSEVLHEADGLTDAGTLKGLLYPVSVALLERVAEVMRSVPADDTSLVNLYANKGGADPLVVACALDGRAADAQYLDAPEWIVVSDDEAVRAKAVQFGVRVIGSGEFKTAIDDDA